MSHLDVKMASVKIHREKSGQVGNVIVKNKMFVIGNVTEASLVLHASVRANMSNE